MTSAPDPYGLHRWADGYFSIGPDGHLRVHTGRSAAPSIDLKSVVETLVARGLTPPLLVRFPEIVAGRIAEIHEAFARAIADHNYEGAYRGVYPIKVNQDRNVVGHILQFGASRHFGLEAGSKPELLVAMALLSDPEALLVCNGYKDRDYVESALDAARLGRRVVLVAEKPSELALVADYWQRGGAEAGPMLGVRVRLASPGAGRWEASSGDRSKFGFSGADLLATVEALRTQSMLASLRLLHFHLGSQISSIRALRDAVSEAAWVYAELVRLGAPLAFLDVGGGLGIDYTGAAADEPSSIDYSLQEYANTVVFGVQEVCDRAGVPHPTLVSESGRATVAHHSVLVVEVVGASKASDSGEPPHPPPGAHPTLHYLSEALESVSPANFREVYHDAIAYRDQCLSLFRLGHLSLEERALAGTLFLAVCQQVLTLAEREGTLPPDLTDLPERLADVYLCNFSIFQSLPDSWAIDQLHPVAPLHRLDEPATARATLADLTCDSDGKVDGFVGPHGAVRYLALPPFRPGEPYYLGIFLVGAYQEILGDLHNLFGDTNSVHVWQQGENDFKLGNTVGGNSVMEVLEYVRYERRELVSSLTAATTAALAAGRIREADARRILDDYASDLDGYTYLEAGRGGPVVG